MSESGFAGLCRIQHTPQKAADFIDERWDMCGDRQTGAGGAQRDRGVDKAASSIVGRLADHEAAMAGGARVAYMVRCRNGLMT